MIVLCGRDFTDGYGFLHGAAPNAVGYQHQTWWALVELLRSAAYRPDAAISLELHDDVGWELAGTPTELLQVKHQEHAASAHRNINWTEEGLDRSRFGGHRMRCRPIFRETRVWGRHAADLPRNIRRRR
jgi:hypothetical protein